MAEKKTARPLEKLSEIEKIRRLVAKDIRNLLIFDFVTQTGLPARHWLGLRIKDISDLQPGDRLPIKGTVKATEYNVFMTTRLYHTFSQMLLTRKPKLKDFVFESRKKSFPLSISSVSRLVKSWFDVAGFVGYDGLLTLRKTYELHFQPLSVAKKPQGKKSAPKVKVARHPTRQEVICRELEKQIVMGKLKPKQRLIVEQIAKQMGMSSIPVREALSNLEARGFITKKPHGTSIVRELSKGNLIELYNLRILLECRAARSAAVNREDSVVDELIRVHMNHEKFREKGDSHSLLLENKKFHLTIYRSANMPMLMDLITLLWDRTSPYHYLFHCETEIENPKKGNYNHHKILAGMQDKDSKKVARWVKKDLQESANFLKKLMDYYHNV